MKSVLALLAFGTAHGLAISKTSSKSIGCKVVKPSHDLVRLLRVRKWNPKWPFVDRAHELFGQKKKAAMRKLVDMLVEKLADKLLDNFGQAAHQTDPGITTHDVEAEPANPPVILRRGNTTQQKVQGELQTVDEKTKRQEVRKKMQDLAATKQTILHKAQIIEKDEHRWRKRISAIYAEHNPDNLVHVDMLLHEFWGEEEMLYLKVCKKYNVTPSLDPKAEEKAKGRALGEGQRTMAKNMTQINASVTGNATKSGSISKKAQKKAARLELEKAEKERRKNVTKIETQERATNQTQSESKKSQFTAHDVLTVVTEMQKLGMEGCYLKTCYDVTSRSIILRFGGPNRTLVNLEDVKDTEAQEEEVVHQEVEEDREEAVREDAEDPEEALLPVREEAEEGSEKSKDESQDKPTSMLSQAKARGYLEKATLENVESQAKTGKHPEVDTREEGPTQANRSRVNFGGYLELDESESAEGEDGESETKSSRYLKFHLLIESGMQMHLVDHFKAVRGSPSQFVMKLRKHLKNRKLVAIKQINYDRVVDFLFGSSADDEDCFHLVVEMYASGNVVLLEGGTHRIMMLLHRHTFQEEQDINQIKIGNVYPWKLATNQPEDYSITPEQLTSWFAEEIPRLDKRIALRKMLIRRPLGVFGTTFIDHLLATYGLTGKKIAAGDPAPFTEAQLAAIPDLLINLHHTPGIGGYLIQNPGGGYNSFVPFRYAHLSEKKLIELPSFLDCLKLYFAPVDQKLLLDLDGQNQKKITLAKTQQLSKVEKITQQVRGQLDNMQKDHDRVEAQRSILESHSDDVTSILAALKERVSARDFRFGDLSTEQLKLVALEPKRDTVTIETEAGTVPLNYQLSYFKNLGTIHQQRKSLEVKQSRTQQVLCKAEKNVNVEKSNAQKKKCVSVPLQDTQLTKDRKSNWFEKYNWFYTSDWYLVIVGKNAQQNEEIVQKYLKAGDRYLHSSVAGSGSGVIKKADVEAAWSDRALEEAGAFLICHTKDWEENAPNRPYWVEESQVSKTPQSGEFVTKGSFIIRGTKNFLSVPRLELGLTVLCKRQDVSGLTAECEDPNLQYMLPMVGPYSCVNKHKMKVKITPGPLKAGKAIKLIQEKFEKTATPLQRTALQLIPDDDWHRVMVTNVRIY